MLSWIISDGQNLVAEALHGRDSLGVWIYNNQSIGIVGTDTRIRLNDDTLIVFSLPNQYDPSHIATRRFDTIISEEQKQRVISIFSSIDSLESTYFNPAYLPFSGLRLDFNIVYKKKQLNTYIQNSYVAQPFSIIDILNKYLPHQYKICYDKEEMINHEKDFWDKMEIHSKDK